MPTLPEDAEGILPDPRYASVHGRPDRPWRAPDVPGATGAAVRALTGRGAGIALAALLAGCAPGAEPQTFAVPSAAAARIRMVCPPGSFVGTMTANCPQILPPAAR